MQNLLFQPDILIICEAHFCVEHSDLSSALAVFEDSIGLFQLKLAHPLWKIEEKSSAEGVWILGGSAIWKPPQVILHSLL